MNIARLPIISLLAITLCSGCADLDVISFSDDVSEASHVLQGNETYSAIPEDQVTVYVYKPNFTFKIIGTIEARGMARGGLLSTPEEKEDVALALKALKKEAASIGANGVIIMESGQVRVSNEATERRIAAIAIRY